MDKDELDISKQYGLPLIQTSRELAWAWQEDTIFYWVLLPSRALEEGNRCLAIRYMTPNNWEFFFVLLGIDETIYPNSFTRENLIEAIPAPQMHEIRLPIKIGELNLVIKLGNYQQIGYADIFRFFYRPDTETDELAENIEDFHFAEAYARLAIKLRKLNLLNPKK